MLDRKLKQYGESDIYPFHMPGHKRQVDCVFNPYKTDITEIDGFDNLHHAEEILLEAQQRAAVLYHSQRSYYLINGSTGGILAAISAVTKKHDKILVARNCHKAVYHAIFLRELSPVYLYPELTDIGIQGQVSVEKLEAELSHNPDIKAVVITSPTYDGVVSDVRRIAELVHFFGIPLIVDGAHGAHFGMAEWLPENAVELGADAVIVSVHKTLPAFTQTALLHLNSERIEQRKIEKYLAIYQTSSPSYVLMAGIERCVRMISENKSWLFGEYQKKLEGFYQAVADLKLLKVVRRVDFAQTEAFAFDETKILIFTTQTDRNGMWLHDVLLNRYHIQVEMTAPNYVLALSSVMDTTEGFDRLAQALMELDTQMAQEQSERETVCGAAVQISDNNNHLTKIEVSHLYEKRQRMLEIHEAEELEYSIVLLEEAEDEISADYIMLYPPGIPLIVPGEKITGRFIQQIRQCLFQKLDVQGLTRDNRIKVVNSKGLYYT